MKICLMGIMDIHGLWIYCVIVLCLAELSTAEKEHMRAENFVSSELLMKGNIDFRGSVRLEWFTYSALVAPKKNSVTSPLSALFPLAGLAIGAVNNSLTELLNAIGLTEKEKIKRHFQHLIAVMRYLPGARMCIASKFYIAADRRLISSYRDRIEEIFQANVERIDFNAPDETADVINSWVYDYTGGRVKDLIQESDITPSTELLLVNAVYFSARWKTPFHKHPITFHTPAGALKVLHGIKVTGFFDYIDDPFLNAKIIKVPFEGDKAFFLIALPNYLNDLTKLLNDLMAMPYMLDSSMTRSHSERLELLMPTFRITTELDMNEIYKKVGLQQIYSNYSGLDKMVRRSKVSLTKAKQKTIISIYAQGTENGEVPVANITNANEAVLPVYVDRPFLFIIMADKQQLISGAVADPSL